MTRPERREVAGATSHAQAIRERKASSSDLSQWRAMPLLSVRGDD